MVIQNITKWIEIEKFLQNKLGKIISTPKRKLCGIYTEKGSYETKTGDNFMAYLVGSKHDAFETYQAYIKYFNYTIQHEGEKERIAISAFWEDED